MKVAVFVDVMQAGDDLVVDGSDEAGSERSTFSRLAELVQVAFHALEDKVEFLGVGLDEGVVYGNDRWMRWDVSKRLWGGGKERRLLHQRPACTRRRSSFSAV
jgi:hypothetical protein